MNKLSKDKQQRILLIALGTAALCGAIWFLVVGGQNSQILKLEDSIYTAQDKLNKAQIRTRRAAIIEEELRKLQQQIGEAEARMIPVEQLNGKKWIFDLLSNFIKNRHNVIPTGLSNDPIIGKQFLPLPKFPYSAAAYDVELRAYYHDFGKFLADFENSFPYISIHQIQIWPIATPSAASGPVADTPEELLSGTEREQLKIIMRVVVLFRSNSSS